MERLSLENTVFEGENNVYLFAGESTGLIDCGVSTPETRADLEAKLAEYGLTFADIDELVLTHYHADHSGLAGAIQAAGGATVYAHRADAPLIAGDPDSWADLEERHRELFAGWGMPADKREELLEFLKSATGIYGEDVSVTAVEDGDRLSVGDVTLETLHAPGHSAGLCCFVPVEGESETGAREVFTGDALLPVYTPNVGGADVRLESPLARYLETLETLIDRDFDRAWPGHRDPIAEPTARAREIYEHHEERAFRVLSVLEAHGPADAWTVSAHLFGELLGIHVLHGPGEAYAHLEHLVETDVIEQTDQGYRLPTESATRLEDCTDDRWPLSL